MILSFWFYFYVMFNKRKLFRDSKKVLVYDLFSNISVFSDVVLKSKTRVMIGDYLKRMR